MPKKDNPNFIHFLNRYFLKNEKPEKNGLILPLLAGYALKVKIIKIKQKLFWPFKRYWQQTTAILLLVCLISGLVFLNNQPKARAASYNWIQTDWSGGRDGGVYPDHTNNQSNWTKYSSEDNYVATSSNIKLKTTTATTSINFTTEGDYTQEDATNGTDFSGGELSLHNVGVGTDAYDKLIMHMDDAGLSDSSSAPHTVTKVGSVAMSSTQSKFGGYSAYLPADGSYPSVSDSADWIFGTDDFTIDMWAYLSDYYTNDGFYSQYTVSDNIVWDYVGPNAVRIQITSGSSVITDGSWTWTPSSATWYHLALVRYGNNLSFYVNGTAIGSAVSVTGDSVPDIGAAAIIGYSGRTGSTFKGYIDEVRVSKGVARWTSNFTPPTGVYANAYPTAQAYYVTTSDSSQLSASTWAGISGISFTQTTPASTNIKYLVSFDGRLSWKYWNGSSWVVSTLDNLQTNGMSSTTLESLSSANWSASGGFEAGTTTKIDFAADLSTSDSSVSPELDNIEVTYASYYTSSEQTLISSPFNTESSANILGGIAWTENIPTGTDIKFQLQTAPDDSGSPGVWSGWMGPNGTDASYFTDPTGGESLPAALTSGGNDQWIQYKIFLSSSNAALTPTLSDITFTYVVNAPPAFDATYGTNGVNISQISDSEDPYFGQIKIEYKIKDTDATQGTITQNYVTPTFEYSLNGGGAWADVSTSTLAFAAAPAGGEVVDTNSDLTIDNKVLEGSYLVYTVYWNAKSQIPENYASNFQIRVTIDDNELANATATATGNAITIDTTNPVLGSSPAYVIATTSPAKVVLDATDNSSLYYKISLDSNFTGASWQTFASSTTITLATDPDTVYVLFRDAYGNQAATSTLATPETPASMMIQDTSNLNPDPDEYRLFLAWKTVAVPFDYYIIYRSADNSTYTELATSTPRTTNYYADNTVAYNTTYYYKVAVQDGDGNVSYMSSAVSGRANGVQDGSEGGGGTETTAPVISNVATSTVYSTQATITWDTDELSDSRVDYITSTGGDFTGAPYKGSTSMLNTAAGVGQHSITLTGLTPATDYYFQVRSTDINSNIATSTYGVNGYMFTTPSGPVISATSTSDIKNTSAVISWTTDIAANSYVVTATTTAFSYTTETGSASSVTSHSVTLTGLSANTIYYYYVKSGDSIDNNGGDYYSFTTTSDTTAPTITFTEATDATVLSDTSVRIVWTTSELATSTVEYGLDTSYASSTSNANLNINQSITLSSLTKGTTYYFRLKSRDSNYNLKTDDNGGAGYTFTTTDSDDITAPTISSVNTNPIMDTKAVISWTTSEAATSLVEYGTTSGTYTTSSSTTALDRSHAVILTGLTQNTTYYYHVVSTDSNSNAATSTEYSFATLETLSQESAVVAREATAYAEGEDSATPTTGGGILMIEKIVEKIVEKIINEEGEEVIADKNPPVISNVSVESTGSDYAVITWNTDEESDSFVEYGADSSYNNGLYGKRNSVISHKITLKWLSPQTIYHFRATSADSSGNVGISAGNIFTTSSFANELLNQEEKIKELEGINQDKAKALEAKENLLKQTAEKAMDIFNRVATQVSIASLESTLALQQNSIDKLANIIPAPVMSGEPRVTVDSKSATIAWQTDKEANSLIAIASAGQYDPAKENSYAQVTGNVDARTKNHLVTIYNLEPETVYHYQLRNKPTVGPVSKSKDFTFTTEKEVLEIQNYTVQKISGQEAIFQWATTVESDSKVKYIPYRNNILAVDEARTKTDSAFTTIHEIAVDDFEAGVGYEIELSSNDVSGNTISKLMPAFFTSEDDLPPLIYQVQTDSAISPGKEVKVQTIISWLTNEPATTRVYYQKGIGSQDELTESIQLDGNYTKKHVAVITKFEPGSVYRFKAESIDSGGNAALSKIYTILIPRQKETVFQIIMKNMEQTFGWVSKLSR